MIHTVATSTEAGTLMRSLRGSIDYPTATGRMLAGYERELMHERAAAPRPRREPSTPGDRRS